MKKRSWILGMAALLAASPVLAQTYPTRAVRLIVPFSPGGGTDVLARAVNQKLGEGLGQPVVIENRPGAGANIGAELAAKAAPDGYTLVLVTISHAINMSLYPKLGYDLARDFSTISLLAVTPHILVLHPSVPAKTVKEFVALAKSRPGQFDYASSGSGSSAHLAAALFGSMTGTSMNHVPYKGGGPAVTSLVGGETSVGFPTMPSVIMHVESGRLRALAVTGAQRSPSLPGVPTAIEAGVPGYDVGTWYGLLAPANTPKEIVARLNAESVKLLKQPDTAGRLHAAGFDAVTSTPEQYAAFTRAEIEKWGKVVKATGVKPD